MRRRARYCGLAVYLTLRFILLLADNCNSKYLYKQNHLKQNNIILCTLKYPHLKQLVHMQSCYHMTHKTSSWAQGMAAHCADFPLWFHEQYQTVFWAVQRGVGTNNTAYRSAAKGWHSSRTQISYYLPQTLITPHLRTMPFLTNFFLAKSIVCLQTLTTPRSRVIIVFHGANSLLGLVASSQVTLT